MSPGYPDVTRIPRCHSDKGGVQRYARWYQSPGKHALGIVSQSCIASIIVMVNNSTGDAILLLMVVHFEGVVLTYADRMRLVVSIRAKYQIETILIQPSFISKPTNKEIIQGSTRLSISVWMICILEEGGGRTGWLGLEQNYQIETILLQPSFIQNQLNKK